MLKKRLSLESAFFSLIIFILIAAGIYIRTKLLILNPSYWFDTCALGLNLEKSFIELTKPLDCIQVAPILFLWISKLFYFIGDFICGMEIEKKDFILRLFPYICGVFSLIIFPFVVQKIFKNRYFTVIALFLLVFNVNAVYYSIEFKQYELEMLIAIILFYIFYDIDLKNTNKRKFWLYSIVTAISIWCSNSSFFLIFAGILVLFFEAHKYKLQKKFLLFFAPFAVSLAIFILGFFMPVYSQMYVDMYNHWSSSDSSFFTFENFAYRFQERMNLLIKTNVNIFIFMLINIGIMIVRKQYKIFMLVTVPFLLVIAAGFLNLYPFHTRLILFLLPFVIILYSQIALLFKYNKYLFICFAIIITVLAVRNLKIPINEYILNKYEARELFLEIKKDNPELKNVISTEGSVILKYYGGIDSIIEEFSWLSFDKSKLPNFFDTAPKGVYYIYSPHNIALYGQDLKEYLINNNDFKTVKIYDGINDSFAAKIEK